MSSILGKRPFLNKILSKCSSENLKKLAGLVNNPGEATTVYLYGSDRVLNSSHIGVNYVHLMIDSITKRYLYGFLVYVDASNCGFFSFSESGSSLVEIEINPSTLFYVDIYENCSAEEFRRTLNDLLIEGGDGDIGNLVAKFEVTDIKAMTKAQLDQLEPGDVVNKITGKAKHSYHVSYKGEGAGQGICLTYSAAGYIETVSYDRSGSNWVYNSTDISHGYSDITVLIEEFLTHVAGYDRDKVQTLKNAGAGLFAWVDDEQ